MQMQCHVRCYIDGGFNVLKQIYRRSDSDPTVKLEDVVNRSSDTNVPLFSLAMELERVSWTRVLTR